MSTDLSYIPTAQHHELFAHFTHLMKTMGGPDVHMKTAGEGTKVVPLAERAWCLSVYNIFAISPSAAAVWARWKPGELRYSSQEDVEMWTHENWKGLHIGTNRRPMHSRAKFARCLKSLADWYLDVYPKMGSMEYTEAWESFKPVYSVGRYVIVKFLESLRRYVPGHEHLEAPDIHPAGAWSPRKSLSYLYPEYSDLLRSDSNSQSTLSTINSLALDLQERVQWTIGQPLSLYELEALLCNYRQTLGGSYYPGNTIDAELEKHWQAVNQFGSDPYLGEYDFFGARKRVFPHTHLGEINGWMGIRKELRRAFPEHGYIWSDGRFNYNDTADLSQPKEW